jgi:hypothetical protein
VSSESSETQAKHSEGSDLAGDGSGELALLSAPNLPAEVGQQLAEELPGLLSARVSDNVPWKVSVASDPLAGRQGSTPVAGEQDSTSSKMLDEASQ